MLPLLTYTVTIRFNEFKRNKLHVSSAVIVTRCAVNVKTVNIPLLHRKIVREGLGTIL